MTIAEKLAIARQLARLRVDVIEAGYPAASDGDWNAVHTIAREIGGANGPIICGLARATERDVDRCWTAVEPAARGRIHIFLATSDVHMKHKLGMTRSQVVAAAKATVSRAFAHGAEVEFSGEDSARSDPEFLYEVLGTALDAGATTLNVPDTVGYATPDEYGELVAGFAPMFTVSSGQRFPPTVTTISDSPWRIRWRVCGPARDRPSVRSTASVSARVTPRSRRW